jgi:hypothetical protein
MPAYEASAVSRADAAAVWDAWTDVAGWAESGHIESAHVDGEFRPGAVITSKAKGMPRSTLTVTRVEQPRVWVDQLASIGVRMTFEHVIESRTEGTVLTERVVISGPLARIVGPLLRRRLETLFAASVAHVARTAEGR